MKVDPADVVWYVFNRKAVTRADISERFGLGNSTTAALVKRLVERGFLIERYTRKGGIGRSPKILTVNPEMARFCGVDMSSGEVKIAVYDFGVSKIYEDSLNLDYRDPVKSLRMLAVYLEDNTREMNIDAIGIALPGILDRDTGYLVNSAVEELEGLDVLGILRSGNKTPVFGINDANAATLAEYYMRGNEEIIMGIFVSKGVGMGLVLKGDVFTGCNGYAGEIANLRIFGESVDEILPGWKIADLFSDPKTCEDREELIEMIVEILSSVVYLIDPGLIVLLSNSEISDSLVRDLDLKLKEYLGYPFNKGTRIEKSVLDDPPTVLGSAIMAIKRWLDVIFTP